MSLLWICVCKSLELLEVCYEMITCLKEKLINPNINRVNEHLIYYMKMQADYQRYLINFLEFYMCENNFSEEIEKNPEFKKSEPNHQSTNTSSGKR